jgi:E1-E2 ATPase
MVYRANKKFQVPAERLVPGDIVSIESGNKVPADLRLLQVKNLRVDESCSPASHYLSKKILHLSMPTLHWQIGTAWLIQEPPYLRYSAGHGNR